MRTFSAAAGVRCFTTMGTSWPSGSRSMRKPRSAGTCSNTMSMTCCSTSCTGRTAMSVSATRVSTFRMRLDFSISETSGARWATAGSAAERRRESSPTLRMMVPASSERGFSSSRWTFWSRVLLKVIWNLPSRMRSPSLRGASMTGTPFTWVPFLDRRSTMRTPSSPTETLACWREMPKSFSTTWHSGERPMNTSPELKVCVWVASPS